MVGVVHPDDLPIIGQLLPGMAYLVRRLLENTSNESFLRASFREGIFDTSHPRDAAIIVTGMGLNLADAIIDAMDADGSVGLDTSGARTSDVLAAYVEAFERILGAQPGSLAP